jgi:hypothetical protein
MKLFYGIMFGSDSKGNWSGFFLSGLNFQLNLYNRKGIKISKNFFLGKSDYEIMEL